MKTFVTALIVLALIHPAWAGLTAAQIATVGVTPPPGAAVPLAEYLQDEAGRVRTLDELIGGRPAVMIFSDFTCRTLCGPVLAMTADGLRRSGLEPATDYHLIVIGLDAKDSLADARAMKTAHLADVPHLADATAMLTGDAGTIARLTRAVGYRYAYDAANDQFAHPNAVLVLTADGHVSRVLTGLGLDAADLRLALVEAGRGRVGNLADHLRLLCYGFDPVAGIYTPSILFWLKIGGGLTVAGLIGLLAALRRRGGHPA